MSFNPFSWLDMLFNIFTASQPCRRTRRRRR